VSSDLEPVSDTIEGVFSRMGLSNPRLMAEVQAEWDTLAGPPWAGRSRPVVIRSRTLVVEASQPSAVAFLRYGVTDLLATLRDRFGEEAVTDVEVVPPGRAQV
jgi:hypothetical protein